MLHAMLIIPAEIINFRYRLNNITNVNYRN